MTTRRKNKEIPIKVEIISKKESAPATIKMPKGWENWSKRNEKYDAYNTIEEVEALEKHLKDEDEI